MKDSVVHTSPESSGLARSVAWRYVTYMFLAGAVHSTLHFGEVIARKSMGASGLEVTLLTMLMPLASLTSIWWGRILIGRDQRRLLLLAGLIGFGAMLTGARVSTISHLIIMHAVFFLTYAVFGPAENRILQQHVPAGSTGSTFGLATGLRMGMAATVSALAGIWMDRHIDGFQQVYPLAALIGIAGLVMVASIPTTRSNGQAVKIDRNLLVGPVREVHKLLKQRPDFLRFELAFMIYGIAFMMMLPVVPVYLVDDLDLSYATIGLARGSVTQVAMIFALPLFGKLFDRSSPHRMAVGVFAALSLYPLILLLAGRLTGDLQLLVVYIAFGMFGIVMSGVIVIWHLSSIRFAGDDDAGVFQSVHVAMTGVRGSFAPMLGLLVMTYFSKEITMLCASGLWILASIMMIVVRRIDIKTGTQRSLRADT